MATFAEFLEQASYCVDTWIQLLSSHSAAFIVFICSGSPGSGKSTLLKHISNTLYRSKDHVVGGSISLSGVTPQDADVVWTNLVGYIDQIDRLHPFLTVFETCEFAWRCRSGGTHRKKYFHATTNEANDLIAKYDTELFQVHKVLEGLGLLRVKDTFVGDQERVRGVSGGEKKRVTVAEMFCVGLPVHCCDEISTGLDGKYLVGTRNNKKNES
jgi:ABC-type multidrug transport system ATPase subunit